MFFESIAYGIGMIHNVEPRFTHNNSEEDKNRRTNELPKKNKEPKQKVNSNIINPSNNKVSREFANDAIKMLYNEKGRIRNAFSDLIMYKALGGDIWKKIEFLQKLGIVGRYSPFLPTSVIISDIDEINRRVDDYFKS